MIPTTNFGSKALHPDMPSALPIHKIKSEGAWGGESEIKNVRFVNFKPKTDGCNRRQVLFERNFSASDYIPMALFENTVFENVDEKAVVWLEDPPQGWANPTDCGEWPCTAPRNAVLKFSNT